ncbi:MAG: head-tail adaptor protein [Lachnospiraceae bacterium]|nr:head-tail adaptor protein [Lachnospiraceae bacterium]MBP3477591.1 head-tail adaptor protein [Lachnospiraceae bacterium]
MIGGNTTVNIQIKTGASGNGIGEKVSKWENIQTIIGFLDLLDEDTKRSTYKTKIQESTHIFISDYVKLDKRIKTENSRLVDEDGLTYDILLIDDPMKMHKQLEIYLKYTGG